MPKYSFLAVISAAKDETESKMKRLNVNFDCQRHLVLITI